MKIGAYRVLVKPALVVLIAAVAIAAVAIPYMKHFDAGREPDFGLVHPERWKFETRNGGDATLTMMTGAGASKLLPVRGGLYNIDASDGFTVVVQKVGTTPDSVYLRNGFSIDPNSPARDLRFTFEAETPVAHNVLFTVRDGHKDTSTTPLWSHMYNISSSDWSTFSDVVPASAIQRRKTADLIIAAQLGDRTGTVSLRNIALR